MWLEQWPGTGARGRRRRRQCVRIRRDCSQSGGRSRGWSGDSACELRRTARAGTPPTPGGNASGGLSRSRSSAPCPPRPSPDGPRQRGWGLPGRGTGSSQAQPPGPASAFSSDSGSLQTQVGGQRTVIVPDAGVAPASRLRPGCSGRERPPGVPSPATEGQPPSHCLAPHLHRSHSRRISFFPPTLSPLEILPRKSKTPICAPSPSLWSNLRKTNYSSGPTVSHS